MPTPLRGSEMVVMLDNSVLGYTQSYTLSVNKALVDVTSIGSGGWKSQYPDMKDWSVDFDGLVSRTVGDSSRGYSYLMDRVTTDASVTIAIKPNPSLNRYEEGVGYMSKITVKVSPTGIVTYSASITGDGPLTPKTTT